MLCSTGHARFGGHVVSAGPLTARRACEPLPCRIQLPVSIGLQQGSAVIAWNDIVDLCQRIAEQFSPHRIVLFGSYARGTATEDSDVDLLVILDHDERNPEKAIEILQAVQPHVPVDLVVRTPAEVEQRLAWNDFFLRDVLTEGRTLYAATEPADA
jgi:uncharacterized protein